MSSLISYEILEVYTGPPTRDRERVDNNLKRKDVEFVTEGNLNTRKGKEKRKKNRAIRRLSLLVNTSARPGILRRVCTNYFRRRIMFLDRMRNGEGCLQDSNPTPSEIGSLGGRCRLVAAVKIGILRGCSESGAYPPFRDGKDYIFLGRIRGMRL